MRTTAESIAARYSLEGPERKGMDERNPLVFVRRYSTPCQERELLRDLILDLQPGQRQEFLVFHAERESQRFSKESTRRTNLLVNAQMAEGRAIPDFRDDADHQRKQGREKGKRLMRHGTEEKQNCCQDVSGATLDERLIAGIVETVRIHGNYLFCDRGTVSTGTGIDATISVMIASAALPRKRARVVVSSRCAST